MTTHKMMGGRIVLEPRPRSPYWYARMKVFKEWEVASTKQTVLADAIVRAAEMLKEREAQVRPPQPNPTFKDYCAAYRARLVPKLKDRKIYKTYLTYLEKYIVEYFGDIESISQRDVEDFYDWHEKQLGRIPAKSTVNCLNVVLRSLFRKALEDGFLDYMLYVSVKDRGVPGESREAFTLEDYRILFQKSRLWKELPTHRKISQYKREILHDMILIIANTGIRPGTEIRNLRWRDVIVSSGKLRIMIREGKTRKKRRVIPRQSCKIYFERLRKLTGHHELCFCMEDGSPFRWENHMFDDLLAFEGRRKKGKVLPALPSYYCLYSLRHFYATQRIIREKVPYSLLAKQMGTSPQMLARHYDQATIEAFPEYFEDLLCPPFSPQSEVRVRPEERTGR